jgi:hypothetical protein
MKIMHVLQITLMAILFSACSTLISVQGTEQQQNSASQNAQSSEPTTTAAAATAAAVPNSNKDTIEENGGEVNFGNAFANLDDQIKSAPPKIVPQARNHVCPVPDKPCLHKEKEFAEWELSFGLPAKIIANKTYSSAPFYAVMLKTYKSEEDCDGGEYIEALENERKEVQTLEPERKVFAAYGCPNMDAVNYDFEGRWDKAKEMVLIDNFIAVYAGQTEEEAETLRRSLRDEYPKAVIKRMTATWERLEQ